MTVVAYPLGRPRTAPNRGGDCRARDLTQGRNVHGPHRFATTACRISNGLLRATVGATGIAPSLILEAYSPSTLVSTIVHTGDTYVDTYADVYGGTTATVVTGSPAEWVDCGTLVLDSAALSALLTGVRIVRLNAESVTIRLVAPLMADAYVTLRRGERWLHVQHGSTRPPRVSTTRRIRLTDGPSPVGVAHTGRVQENADVLPGLFRWVASIETVTANAGAFSLTSAADTTVRFGAGVATDSMLDAPMNQHQQLFDGSPRRIAASIA